MSLGEYLLSVLAICSAVGILWYISYQGASSSAVKYAFSILVLYTVSLPVLGLCSVISDFDGEITEILPSIEYEGEGEYERVAEEAFRVGISEYVSEKFDLRAECVEVSVSGFDFSSMSAEKITVILKGSALSADWRSIEEDLSGSGLGKCEVRLVIG